MPPRAALAWGTCWCAPIHYAIIMPRHIRLFAVYIITCVQVLPGGRLLAAGGEWGNGASFQLARQQVEEFSWGGPGGAGGPDAARGVWVAKAPLPEARFRCAWAWVTCRDSRRALTFLALPIYLCRVWLKPVLTTECGRGQMEGV